MSPSPPRLHVSHLEIVTLAVYLLGGESGHVDTEDAAVKANEIAPGRFIWRKYPNQINLEIVRVYLSDAKKPAKGSYLLGSGREGWLLTEAGLRFAREQARSIVSVDLSRKPMSPKEQQKRRHERVRMMTSDAFGKFQVGGPGAVTPQEAEAFFRIDDYVVGSARERKMVRILNTYADDPDLSKAVKELAKKVRGRHLG
jgi:hypothetical protein